MNNAVLIDNFFYSIETISYIFCIILTVFIVFYSYVILKDFFYVFKATSIVRIQIGTKTM